MSKMPFFFFAILVASMLGCQETVVYVEVPSKPAIIGTWDWFESRDSFGQHSYPTSVGYSMFYEVSSDSIMGQYKYYFVNGDTIYTEHIYTFESLSPEHSAGTLVIKDPGTRSETVINVSFIGDAFMKWEPVGPESGLSFYTKRNR